MNLSLKQQQQLTVQNAEAAGFPLWTFPMLNYQYHLLVVSKGNMLKNIKNGERNSNQKVVKSYKFLNLISKPVTIGSPPEILHTL